MMRCVFQFLRSFRRPAPTGQPAARIPEGERVYAIGDIHGRLDLLTALAEAIEEDARGRPRQRSSVVLLGDLVDRGPDSAGVVALARLWQRHRPVRILCGNHEEMFLRSFDNVDILRHFLRHGGRETLYSYGIGKDEYRAATIEEVQRLMHERVPQEDRDFIESFEDMVALGDYLFVHAGIDPAAPLAEQKPSDLRWIREPFLSHGEPVGAVVVHGHTIVDNPAIHVHRIGIDTGAYASGRLTALVLEGAGRRFLQASAGPEGISVGPWEAPGGL